MRGEWDTHVTKILGEGDLLLYKKGDCDDVGAQRIESIPQESKVRSPDSPKMCYIQHAPTIRTVCSTFTLVAFNVSKNRSLFDEPFRYSKPDKCSMFHPAHATMYSSMKYDATVSPRCVYPEHEKWSEGRRQFKLRFYMYMRFM